MSIALLGASGNAGARILKELSDRGHKVTAIARHPEKIAKLPHVTAVKGDVNDKDALTALLKGHDIVISSVHFTVSDPRILIDAAKAAHVKRYLVVGGAGSLEVAPGVALVTTPDFPEQYKPEALAGSKFLELLRHEKELDWTFLSPSALFVPGEGYQALTGSSGFPYLDPGQNVGGIVTGTTGGNSGLIGEVPLSKFKTMDEKEWVLKYSYNLSRIGLQGLAFNSTYVSGHDARVNSKVAGQNEWVRSVGLSYKVPDSLMKGVTLAWKNVTYRTNVTGNHSQDQNILLVSYQFGLVHS